MNSTEKNTRFTVTPGQAEDLPAVARLAAQMWEHPDAELEAEFSALIGSPDGTIFAAKSGGEVVGFAQCQLRRDYVEGTSTSPVGYLEGIFVAPAHRNRGIAAALLRACEAWAREKGCAEFASDCELGNTDSLRFHQSLGFTEANRIICFTKKL
jgi:aminoglycoside 6'-N-acetyltransferase I